MKKLMHLFVLSCKKATELIEKKTMLNLSFKEKIQLRIHKSICDACTSYEKQSQQMEEILKAQNNTLNNLGQQEINQPLKDRIISKLP